MDPPRNCSGQSREVACPRQKVELEDLLNELKLDRADEERTTQILKRLSNITRKSTWKGPLPNLRDTFQQEEVNRILMNIVDHIIRKQIDYSGGMVIIGFIARTGYRHEPEIDKDGKIRLHLTTPLHVAAKYKYNVDVNYFIVPDLFKIYRDGLNYTDELGVTHFHVACMYSGGIKLAPKFLELGQDPNLLVESTGDSPLHLCLSHSWDTSLVELLLKKGANPNVANKLGITPLQFAVANLMDSEVDLLVNHGANLSDFVFPTFSRFEASLESLYGEVIGYVHKLEIASSAMRVVDRLERGGYELDLDDALTIMKCFAKWELFEISVNDKRLLCKDFETRAKKIIVKSNLSLYDLIQLRPREAAKLVTPCDLSRSVGFDALPKATRKYCVTHLCQTPRELFRSWAQVSFMELMHYRLPDLCCKKIIEKLTNEDFYHICLAAQDQSHEDRRMQ